MMMMMMMMTITLSASSMAAEIGFRGAAMTTASPVVRAEPYAFSATHLNNSLSTVYRYHTLCSFCQLGHFLLSKKEAKVCANSVQQ